MEMCGPRMSSRTLIRARQATSARMRHPSVVCGVGLAAGTLSASTRLMGGRARVILAMLRVGMRPAGRADTELVLAHSVLSAFFSAMLADTVIINAEKWRRETVLNAQMHN